MRILVAPQEFKGTLTAIDAAAAMAEGARSALPEAAIVELPLADGGPGTVQAILAAAGGRAMTTRVSGPLGDPVDAAWGILPDGTAVIEMAAAAGLTLLAPAVRDPRLATTFGVGELIRGALGAGCAALLIGLGGSATNDGGAGMAQALGARLLDANGRELGRGGAELAKLERINMSGFDTRVRAARVTGATDVRNPLCGPEGASIVYGPQKGATPQTARELDTALRRYAGVIDRDLGVGVLNVPGAGSAGGLGAGLIALLGAEIHPGIEVVGNAVRLRERVLEADLVITGEGRLDAQTGYGKTVAGVAEAARAAGVPVIIVAGSLGDGWENAVADAAVVEAADAATEMPPRQALAHATKRAVRRWRR